MDANIEASIADIEAYNHNQQNLQLMDARLPMVQSQESEEVDEFDDSIMRGRRSSVYE